MPFLDHNWSLKWVTEGGMEELFREYEKLAEGNNFPNGYCPLKVAVVMCHHGQE